MDQYFELMKSLTCKSEVCLAAVLISSPAVAIFTTVIQIIVIKRSDTKLILSERLKTAPETDFSNSKKQLTALFGINGLDYAV